MEGTATHIHPTFECFAYAQSILFLSGSLWNWHRPWHWLDTTILFHTFAHICALLSQFLITTKNGDELEGNKCVAWFAATDTDTVAIILLFNRIIYTIRLPLLKLLWKRADIPRETEAFTIIKERERKRERVRKKVTLKSFYEFGVCRI